MSNYRDEDATLPIVASRYLAAIQTSDTYDVIRKSDNTGEQKHYRSFPTGRAISPNPSQIVVSGHAPKFEKEKEPLQSRSGPNSPSSRMSRSSLDHSRDSVSSSLHSFDREQMNLPSTNKTQLRSSDVFLTSSVLENQSEQSIDNIVCVKNLQILNENKSNLANGFSRQRQPHGKNNNHGIVDKDCIKVKNTETQKKKDTQDIENLHSQLEQRKWTQTQWKAFRQSQIRHSFQNELNDKGNYLKDERSSPVEISDTYTETEIISNQSRFLEKKYLPNICRQNDDSKSVKATTFLVNNENIMKQNDEGNNRKVEQVPKTVHNFFQNTNKRSCQRRNIPLKKGLSNQHWINTQNNEKSRTKTMLSSRNVPLPLNSGCTKYNEEETNEIKVSKTFKCLQNIREVTSSDLEGALTNKTNKSSYGLQKNGINPSSCSRNKVLNTLPVTQLNPNSTNNDQRTYPVEGSKRISAKLYRGNVSYSNTLDVKAFPIKRDSELNYTKDKDTNMPQSIGLGISNASLRIFPNRINDSKSSIIDHSMAPLVTSRIETNVKHLITSTKLNNKANVITVHTNIPRETKRENRTIINDDTTCSRSLDSTRSATTESTTNNMPQWSKQNFLSGKQKETSKEVQNGIDEKEKQLKTHPTVVGYAGTSNTIPPSWCKHKLSASNVSLINLNHDRKDKETNPETQSYTESIENIKSDSSNFLENKKINFEKETLYDHEQNRPKTTTQSFTHSGECVTNIITNRLQSNTIKKEGLLDYHKSVSLERNGLKDQEKECSKVQQLERKINIIQPETTFWSERNMKSSQILHTANIRSHKITGNSSESEKVVKYSHPSQIENQIHPLQKSKDNFVSVKSRVLAWNPTINIEDLPATKLKQSHHQDMLDTRQLEHQIIDISQENPCLAQTSNKGYLKIRMFQIILARLNKKSQVYRLLL